MRCIICHGETIGPATVNEELSHEADIVRVPVEVLVCQTCGERYYDRQTMRFLEKVQKELTEGRAGLTPVGQVLRYG